MGWDGWDGGVEDRVSLREDGGEWETECTEVEEGCDGWDDVGWCGMVGRRKNGRAIGGGEEGWGGGEEGWGVGVTCPVNRCWLRFHAPLALHSNSNSNPNSRVGFELQE